MLPAGLWLSLYPEKCTLYRTHFAVSCKSHFSPPSPLLTNGATAMRVLGLGTATRHTSSSLDRQRLQATPEQRKRQPGGRRRGVGKGTKSQWGSRWEYSVAQQSDCIYNALSYALQTRAWTPPIQRNDGCSRSWKGSLPCSDHYTLHGVLNFHTGPHKYVNWMSIKNF